MCKLLIALQAAVRRHVKLLIALQAAVRRHV